MGDKIIKNLKADFLLDNIQEGCLVVDGRKNIIFINKGAENALNWKKRQMIGKNINAMLAPSLEKNPQSAAYQLKKGSGDIYVNAKGGERKHISYSLTSLNKPDIAVIFFNDLSKEDVLEEEKSKFISIISHELRTPASNIKWMLELSLDPKKGKLDKKRKEYMEEAWRNVKRLIKLINEVIDISKLNLRKFKIHKQKIDLVELVDETIQDFSFFASASNINIEHKAPEKKVILNSDRAKMKIVMTNILSNAIKYTRRGYIYINYSLKPKYCLISVKDTGIGIPKEDQEKIFNKFFRASNVNILQAEGTGLGLYISKSIIEFLGGEMWFESAKGKGTTFFVKMPLK